MIFQVYSLNSIIDLIKMNQKHVIINTRCGIISTLMKKKSFFITNFNFIGKIVCTQLTDS